MSDDLHLHDWGDATPEVIRSGRAECVDPECPDRPKDPRTQPKLTLEGALHEIIPALWAAGLTEVDIRVTSEETQRRMGEGGTTAEWIKMWGHVLSESGNEQALMAYTLAVMKWLSAETRQN